MRYKCPNRGELSEYQVKINDEWWELLELTRNDDWETDELKYDRVRILARKFGGAPLPKKRDGVPIEKVRKVIVVREPNGNTIEFSRLQAASHYLDCDSGNLRKYIRRGHIVRRGKLTGYCFYEREIIEDEKHIQG